MTGSHQLPNQLLLQSTLPIRRRRYRAHTYQPEDAATAHTYLPEDTVTERTPTHQKSLLQSAVLPICRRCYRAHTSSIRRCHGASPLARDGDRALTQGALWGRTRNGRWSPLPTYLGRRTDRQPTLTCTCNLMFNAWLGTVGKLTLILIYSLS